MAAKPPPYGVIPPIPKELEDADPSDSIIVAASKRGRVTHDERGQAQWKWATEANKPSDPNAETFDYLEAIDAWETAIADTQTRKALKEEPPTRSGGCNPYDKPPK